LKSPQSRAYLKKKSRKQVRYRVRGKGGRAIFLSVGKRSHEKFKGSIARKKEVWERKDRHTLGYRGAGRIKIRGGGKNQASTL